jgi:NhaP-type Na+/H+ or K+/H+ antiporter
VLAENLGGSGVLAVTALGIFFGNVYVKEKIKLLETESALTKAFLILLFILTGIVIRIPYTAQFFITSGLLFAAFVVIRFIGTSISLKKYSWHEKLYITLNAPKGIATITVGFVLAIFNIPEVAIVADMAIAFFLYSIILATITTWVTNENRTR